MGSSDRVRYFERQFLRSDDFTAEQLYHIEMRRRLNVALHLWGIVDGLDVLKGPIVQGAPDQFYVSRGLAIDAYGREIVFGVDYLLTDDDLTRNRIAGKGIYFISVAYRRELTTPPAPGYRLCNVDDQFTRWHEGFEILITATNPTPPGATAPAVTDALPDDPLKKPWPVPLGTITIDLDPANKPIITEVAAKERTYIGLRAQQIVAPVASLSGADAKLPIQVKADLLAAKNLAVGKDLIIDKAKVVPPPAANPFPADAGNLDVDSDLFIRGNLYTYDAPTDKWLALSERLRQLAPDVQVGSQLVTIDLAATVAGDTPGSVMGTTTIPLKTTLTQVAAKPKNPNMTVSLSAVHLHNFANLNTWKAGVTQSDPVRLEVRFKAATKVDATTWNFEVEWIVAPVEALVNPPAGVQTLTFSYVAVFMP